MQHNCAECAYLTRTSPTQVFLLCSFWAATYYPTSGVSSEYDYDYVVGHCHMQPEAPACPFFKPKAVSREAARDTSEVLCTC